MPASNVLAARQALGLRLREIRMEAGHTAKSLAAAAGWYDGTKVSKIEHGKQTPSSEDIRAWCRACDAEDQAEDLLASVRDIAGMYVEWRRRQKTGLRQVQKSAVPLYEATRHFRIYQPAVVPGLFQTPEYTMAVMKKLVTLNGVPDDTEQAVQARMERQNVLYTGDRRFAVVLEEPVLHTWIGGAEAMAGQLDRLMAVISLPRVSLGIIPTDTKRAMFPTSGFWIFDEERVLVELPSAELTVSQPREIALYLKTFTENARQAVHGADARALITKALEALP
ncbi:helix-turn-helix transcriptional regulator [Actinocorallia sp. A-T 12471]|uniref:helix-turn-helix domain-containing protein n=1 Tax=Actinocorallia sp. A-T 12471 TaxID=3089813 RepID=UPI0029CCDCEA|nr:helix-turn-helix transcriptional regulator [Actinocorallia sp. A-T 12471]MDX6741442.1 helix-turn-helix transcriptional regulator [Actinocorallia sp. A-T 12471]